MACWSLTFFQVAVAVVLGLFVLWHLIMGAIVTGCIIAASINKESIAQVVKRLHGRLFR